MKKLFFLISFYFLFFVNAFAQNPLVKQWDKRFGGTTYDYLTSFQQTSDGGYILAGYSNSEIGGDKTQDNWDPICNPVCWEDYWIVKIDSLGNKQWDKTFGGTLPDKLTSIEQTNDGGYILGGYSFSDSSGDKTENLKGGGDFWIIKIDSLGIKQWDKDFGGLASDNFSSLQQTTDGGYILAGTSYSGIGGDKTQSLWDTCSICLDIFLGDYWIVKIDSLGNKQWDKDFGGAVGDELKSIRQTIDGGYIIGGNSNSSISGDKTQSNWDTSNQTMDYWLVKIDSLGNKQWDKDFGGTTNDNFYSLKQTIDGGYILAGLSESGISGNKTQASWGLSDYWIVKTDSLGNIQWDKDFGGTNDEDDLGNISQTTDKGYLIGGTSYSNIGGDKTENNLSIEQTWVVKTDSLGTKQWDKTVFTFVGHDETGLTIQTKDGCYAMANYTPAGIGGYKTQPNWGTWNSGDYWLIKFCDSTLTSTPNIESQISNFSLHPNPTKNILSFHNPQFKITTTKIFNTLGKEITISKNQIAKNKNETQLNIASLSSGIYLLRLTDEKGNFYSAKFVKE